LITGIESSKPKAEALSLENSIPKWLLFGSKQSEEDNKHVEYEGYDGWYNNRANQKLGAVGNYEKFVIKTATLLFFKVKIFKKLFSKEIF